jgi:hypothetical protein
MIQVNLLRLSEERRTFSIVTMVMEDKRWLGNCGQNFDSSCG